MEDHADSGAFDVEGAAILAATAVVGHHRERLLLAFSSGFQVFQRLFHLQQIEGHPPQRLIRLLRLAGGLFGARAQRSQELLFLAKPVALALYFMAQLGAGVLLVVQASGDLLKLLADFSHLQLHLDLFACQLVVQGVAFLLPGRACLLLKAFALGLLSGRTVGALLGHSGRLAPRSGLGGLVGFAVHDQQHQNQRSHRTQQHGKEGER